MNRFPIKNLMIQIPPSRSPRLSSDLDLGLPTVLLAALLSGGSCVKPTLVRPEPWGVGDPLPVLERRPLIPLSATSGHWDAEFRNWRSGDNAPGEPFESDDQAVGLAKAWATARFEIHADDLDVTAIDHSASGKPEPQSVDDRGHTIVLEQLFRGIPTDGFAVVYIRGKTVTSAAVGFYEYNPLPETAKPSIPSQQAVSTWRRLFKQRGANEESLAEYDAAASPRLEYVYSYRFGAEVEHAVPTWVVVKGMPYMVDAHTGRAWIND